MPGSGTNMEIVQLIIGIIILLAAFIVKWKVLSRVFIPSGLKKEDLKFYDIKSVYKNLKNNKEPNAKLIIKHAKDIEKRTLLLECLSKFDRLDLFPKEYYTLEKLSASYLSNWLNLNDYYDSIPDKIEFCKDYDLENGIKIFLFKCKSYEAHLLDKGWIYGYVGYKQKEISRKPEFIYSDFGNDKIDNLNLENKIKEYTSV